MLLVSKASTVYQCVCAGLHLNIGSFLFFSGCYFLLHLLMPLPPAFTHLGKGSRKPGALSLFLVAHTHFRKLFRQSFGGWVEGRLTGLKL